jgi:hypothetical protein
MDKVVVSVVCGAAVLAALAMAIRWGGMDVSLRADHQPSMAGALRRLCVLEVSGIVSGVLVGGLGSRLMMRIMAATSGASAQGRITQADEVVGRVTSGGTVGLLIFVGIGSGVLGALIYAIAGRFLPRRAWASGLVLGLLVLGLFARRDPLSPDNRDFTILSPVLLAVLLIAALFLLYGVTLAALSARLERIYPPLQAKPLSLVAHLPLLLFVFPPFTIAPVAAAAIGEMGKRLPALGAAWRSNSTRLVGRTAIVAATVAGNVWLGSGVADILT